MLKKYAGDIAIEQKRTENTVKISDVGNFVVPIEIGKICFHLFDSPGLGNA